MNKEKQRITIAEACGWKYSQFAPIELKYFAIACWIPPNYTGYIEQELPDYLKDLNAMHDAIAYLTPEQVDLFAMELSAIVFENRHKAWWDLNANEVGHVANANAEKRAEAFLKALGKWEDDE